ncbi:MAG: type II toxin-antitoxin system Phd/YefM family antitoxin [Desulfoplanes sp.]|nr:type II toxin-antitoxin system Phd/YefM family antitoxin [Desulfoplanes sp.]
MPLVSYLSATTLSKQTSATLDSLDSGELDTMIIMKNNTPKAVLLSMEAYETMVEELEDLRLEAIAQSRVRSFDPNRALTHEAMMEKFAK